METYYVFLFGGLVKTANLYYAENFSVFFSVFNSSPPNVGRLLEMLSNGDTGEIAKETELNLVGLGRKQKIKIFRFVFEEAVPLEIVRANRHSYLKVKIAENIFAFCRIKGGRCLFL